MSDREGSQPMIVYRFLWICQEAKIESSLKLLHNQINCWPTWRPFLAVQIEIFFKRSNKFELNLNTTKKEKQQENKREWKQKTLQTIEKSNGPKWSANETKRTRNEKQSK